MIAFLVEMLQGPNKQNQYLIASSEIVESVNMTMTIFMNQVGMSSDRSTFSATIAATASKVRSELAILIGAIFEGHVRNDIPRYEPDN